MKIIESMPGDRLYDVLSQAVEEAPAQFNFNGMLFITRVGETLGDARARFKEEHGVTVSTPQEDAERAGRDLEEMRQRQAAAIASAKVATEAEMREMEAPSFSELSELSAYIQSLVDRPHDYGTCVFAMSYAATAAFNYVAHKLGVTGFQAECADMDILRQTRHWNWGRLLDYENLLYPQYCNDESFPSAASLLANDDIKTKLAEMARVKIAECDKALMNPTVLAHWQKLAAAG